MNTYMTFLTRSSGKEPNHKPKLSERAFPKYSRYQTYSRSQQMSWSCFLEMRMRTGASRVGTLAFGEDSQAYALFP